MEPDGRITPIRLPTWALVISFALIIPICYFFLRQASHTAMPTASQKLFLLGYSFLIGLNYTAAIKYREVIFKALPSWLVPTWRRIVAYMIASVLVQCAIASLPLSHFYSEVPTHSVIFLFIPYFLLVDPSRNSGRFLLQALTPSGRVSPALFDSHQPLTFTYNTRKSVFIVTVGFALVLAGLFLRNEYPVAAWCIIGFFGLCLLIGIVAIIPGSTCLIIDDEGFVMVHLWRRFQYRWTDVRDIELVSLSTSATAPGMTVVGFNLTEAFRQNSPRSKKLLKSRKWVHEMCGKDALLSSNYNVSPADLCRIMIQRQARALHAAAS